MHPEPETDETGGDDGENHGGVSEDFAARVGADDLRDETQRGNEDDVHLRMSEEPKDVLVEQGSPPSAGLTKCVATVRSERRNELAIMTAGMAKMTMKDCTSIDQQ